MMLHMTPFANMKQILNMLTVLHIMYYVHVHSACSQPLVNIYFIHFILVSYLRIVLIQYRTR